MLTLLPVALLLLSAVVIQVFGRVTRRAGSTWLLAAVMGFVTWLSMIPIGLLLPSAVTISDWLPDPYPFATISFQATNETWIFGFLLVSMLQAVILYNARNLDSPNYLNKITGAMALSAFGLLAAFSRTPLAFVLTWSLMDLAEFGVLTATVNNEKENRTTLTTVLFRELGIILLVLLMSIVPEQTGDSEGLSNFTAWLFLMISLLRMGILPLRAVQVEDLRNRRGFMTLLRAIPLLTAFSFFTISINIELPVRTIQLLFLIFSIAILYGSMAWFFSKDELSGRPYWFFCLGSLGFIAFLSGRPGALIALAAVAITGGTGIFLSSPRFRRLYIYLPVLLLGLLALPYSPTALFNEIFVGENDSVQHLFMIPAYAFLVAGVIKHALQPVEEPDIGEAWTGLFHRISLFFIALVPWIIMGVRFKIYNVQVNWWVSVIIIGFISGLTALFFLFSKRQMTKTGLIHRILAAIVKISGVLDKILRFNWLARIISSIGFIFTKLANLLIRVQEGDGGILWSFLFLVLLFSLLLTRQVP